MYKLLSVEVVVLSLVRSACVLASVSCIKVLLFQGFPSFRVWSLSHSFKSERVLAGSKLSKDGTAGVTIGGRPN